MFSPLEQFDAIRILYISFFGLFDITFFNIIIPLILNILIFLFVIDWFKGNLFLIPRNIQFFFELLITFLFNLIKQQIGPKGYSFFPLIFLLFNFILICNLLSLIPFGIALTSHIILILWLSLSLCLSIFIIGLLRHNVAYLKIFIPPCPLILLPILILIEIFSYIIRAFSLAIRLSANIMAGHTLIVIVSSFILSLMNVSGLFFIFFAQFILAITLLELGVSFLQAYVFTVLVCIYLNDSVKNPSH